nr:MAG TPA: hypothetical protein [Caudoviricetes sp.]
MRGYKAICCTAPPPVAGGGGANQNTIATGSPIDIVLHIGILLLTCDCELYKLRGKKAGN